MGLAAGMRTGMICETTRLFVGCVFFWIRGLLPLLDMHMECVLLLSAELLWWRVTALCSGPRSFQVD